MTPFSNHFEKFGHSTERLPKNGYNFSENALEGVLKMDKIDAVQGARSTVEECISNTRRRRASQRRRNAQF